MGATRNTRLYLRRLSPFACSIARCPFPQSPISLGQSSRLDNGSDVALLTWHYRGVTNVKREGVSMVGLGYRLAKGNLAVNSAAWALACSRPNNRLPDREDRTTVSRP